MFERMEKRFYICDWARKYLCECPRLFNAESKFGSIFCGYILKISFSSALLFLLETIKLHPTIDHSS